MVISKILMLLRDRHLELKSSPNYIIEKIVAIHIDYANRPESAAEAAFVQEWCEKRAKFSNDKDESGMVFKKRVVQEVNF